MDLETLPWAHSFGAALVVGCGSRDDPHGLEGTAHMAEHLNILTGPPACAPGLPVLAVTEIDRTVFRATGDPDDSAASIQHLTDIAGGRRGNVTPDVFEGERHAVLLETRRMDHQPLLRLGPLIAAAAADEPGLDSIARTTAQSISNITPADVTRLVRHSYPGARSQLFVAGPPSLTGVVEDLLTRHEEYTAATAQPAAAPVTTAQPAGSPVATAQPAGSPVATAQPTGSPSFVPGGHQARRATAPAVRGLSDLVAVTLLRPRTPSTALGALLDARGPIVGLGAGKGLRPLGRTTIAGRTQQVDVVVWRAGDITALLERSLPSIVADWYRLTEEPRARLENAATLAGRRDQAGGPSARVRAAAEQYTFPDRPHGTPRAALWKITEGVPDCLGAYPLPLSDELDRRVK
ncbi:insulinase family protein [Streptomyces murinus]|uniref:insulinase family protein n=1 Tax=Streptomyces murinus TaxID=33900 RepID=UPI000A1D646F|nr:insulinase family protein [Streptomyces murinus]WDO06491.1 insulinase family protein [Streptomyces murinus]